MKVTVQPRTIIGKQSKQLRNEGIIPAAMYGPLQVSTNIQIDAKEFRKLFDAVGYSKFFYIELEGQEPKRALVKEAVKHPIKDYIENVSFYVVDENRKVYVDVPIELSGNAPAVAMKLGFLVQPLETITVHCLPKDLPEEFTLDISSLKEVGDVITVGDISLPEGVELGSSMDTTSALAYIAAPQRVIEEDTTEGEESEEGEEESGEEAGEEEAQQE